MYIYIYLAQAYGHEPGAEQGAAAAAAVPISFLEELLGAIRGAVSDGPLLLFMEDAFAVRFTRCYGALMMVVLLCILFHTRWWRLTGARPRNPTV